jgi:hypothetical protein
MAKQPDYHQGVRVNVRAPNQDTHERWKAAAKSENRSLNNWLCGLANAASLPIRKKNVRGA